MLFVKRGGGYESTSNHHPGHDLREMCLPCGARAEGLPGVFDLDVRLVDGIAGEVDIGYDPSRLKRNEIKVAISAASGPRHEFVVLSVIEW